MKKLALALSSISIFFFLITNQLTAQTNTFPDSGKVGIGTTNPIALLDIRGLSSGQRGLDITGSVGNSHIPYTNGQIYLTGDVSPNATGTGDLIFRTYNGSNYSHKFFIKGTSGNVGIGIGNPDEKLTVNGKAKVKELIVEENIGADFVFAEEYTLHTIFELEEFIKINKHLPEIPSAAEMKQDGVKVGDLQMRLLQKIEELTLYVIQLKKENANLHELLKNQGELVEKLNHKIKN